MFTFGEVGDIIMTMKRGFDMNDKSADLKNINIIKEMLKSGIIPTTCNLLEMLDIDEMLDDSENLIYNDSNVRLWVHRFINDEIDRLKQITKESDDESLYVELARILSMGIIGSVYDNLIMSIGVELRSKISSEDNIDVENA